MKSKGQNGGGGRLREGARAQTAAGQVRAADEDFSESLAELKKSVRKACSHHAEWQSRVIAGIHAVLDFTAANPAKAYALTADARRGGENGTDPQQGVIEHFAELLAHTVPVEKLFPISTEVGIVEAIAVVVRGHLLGGTAEQLPEAASDLIYLALMPYLGLAETTRLADASALSHC